MKALKAVVALGLLAVVGLAVLRVLGFIDDNQALDYGGKSVGVIFIIGIGLGAVMMLLDSRKPPGDSSSSGEPGPKF